MGDSRSASAEDGTETDDAENADTGETDGPTTEELRQQVEERYDFDTFGPEEMAEMSPAEWEAAFDPDSWITGPDLLDRLEADLRNRIADRDVFAVLERPRADVLLAYSDEGYAIVEADGTVEGEGTVVRDVKPSVALCSMEEYEVADPPEGGALPDPEEVPESGGERGNHMLQFVATAQLVAGLGLIVGWLGFGANILAMVAGLGFLVIALLLLLVVANARLSDRFRAEEYRDRLRAAGVESGERPEFVPAIGGEKRRDERTAREMTDGDGGDSEPSGDGRSDD